MILVTGGAWQGKSAFARTLAAEQDKKRNVEPEACSKAEPDAESNGKTDAESNRNLDSESNGKPDAESNRNLDSESNGKPDAEFAIIEDIHLLVKDALHIGRDPREEIKKRIRQHPNVILTVNELGCGIVPVEAFDREWRELTGRICCELARQAEVVYRVTCGIATRIK